jgi:hypothetical protein
MRHAVGLVVVLVLLSTGVSEQPPTVALGQSFELAPGDAVIVAETGTLLTFHGVEEDSRCPAQVTCIWAGRVTIAVDALAPGGDTDAFTLATCCTDDVREHAYAGQTFALVDVTPAAGAPDQPIGDQDYRAQLSVR